MGAVKQNTMHDELWKRRYENLFARAKRLTDGLAHDYDCAPGHDYAPEGSCLAFLRWEEFRRGEELRRVLDGDSLGLIQRRLAVARMDGFTDAVTYLSKLQMAYEVPKLGEIR